MDVTARFSGHHTRPDIAAVVASGLADQVFAVIVAFEAGGWSFVAGHNVPAKLADFPQQPWGQRLFVGGGWEHPEQDQERGCLWLKQEETDEAVSGCGK